MNFSQRLHLIRITYGLSMQKFAELIGLKSKSTLSFLENNKTVPNADTLIKIQNTFGISLDWLCGISDEPFTYASIINAEHSAFAKIAEIDPSGKTFKNFSALYLDDDKRPLLYKLNIRANILILMHVFYFEFLEHSIKQDEYSSYDPDALARELERKVIVNKINQVKGKESRAEAKFAIFSYFLSLMVGKEKTPLYDLPNAYQEALASEGKQS